MPLAKGQSRSVIAHNIREMRAAGHGRAQSIAAALHQAGMAKKQRRYAEAEGGAAINHEPFLAAIAHNPRAPHPLAVYRDHLSERGHPLAELVHHHLEGTGQQEQAAYHPLHIGGLVGEEPGLSYGASVTQSRRGTPSVGIWASHRSHPTVPAFYKDFAPEAGLAFLDRLPMTTPHHARSRQRLRDYLAANGGSPVARAARRRYMRPEEHDPFIRAIIENPDQAAPSLVYADRLAEEGDPLEAIIRGHFAQQSTAPSFQPRASHIPYYPSNAVLEHRDHHHGFYLSLGGARTRGNEGVVRVNAHYPFADPGHPGGRRGFTYSAEFPAWQVYQTWSGLPAAVTGGDVSWLEKLHANFPSHYPLQPPPPATDREQRQYAQARRRYALAHDTFRQPIFAHPQNPGPLGVYADELEQEAHPLGEVIRRHLERDQARSRGEIVPTLAVDNQHFTLGQHEGVRYWLRGSPYTSRVHLHGQMIPPDYQGVSPIQYPQDKELNWPYLHADFPVAQVQHLAERFGGNVGHNLQLALHRLGHRPAERPAQEQRQYAQAQPAALGAALGAASSQNQGALRSVAEKVLSGLGLEPSEVHDAVHDSPAGSLPDLVQSLWHPRAADPRVARVAAAHYGLLGNRPGVLAFTPRRNGPNVLHILESPTLSGATLQRALNQAGVGQRTIQRTAQGFRVFAYGVEGLRMQRAAQLVGGQLHSLRGTGMTLGGPDGGAARAAYRNVIRGVEEPHQHARRVDVQGIRDSVAPTPPPLSGGLKTPALSAPTPRTPVARQPRPPVTPTTAQAPTTVSPAVQEYHNLRAAALPPPSAPDEATQLRAAIAQFGGPRSASLNARGRMLLRRLGLLTQPGPQQKARRDDAGAEADPERAFHAHLDEYPDDHDSRKVFADWLEERGDPRGEALRWLAERQRYALPHYPHHPHHSFWSGPGLVLHLPECHFHLPAPLMNHLEPDWNSRIGTWSIHPSRRAAEDAFANAYHAAKAQGWNPDADRPPPLQRESRRERLRRKFQRPALPLSPPTGYNNTLEVALRRYASAAAAAASSGDHLLTENGAGLAHLALTQRPTTAGAGPTVAQAGQALTGHEVALDDLLRSANAVDGMHVALTAYAPHDLIKGDRSYYKPTFQHPGTGNDDFKLPDWDEHSPVLHTTVWHAPSGVADYSNAGYFARSQLYRTHAGTLASHFDYLINQGSSPVKGQGKRIFHAQVEALRRLGVTAIHSQLERNDAGGYVGYAVWPKMGFNGALKPAVVAQLPPALRQQLPPQATVQDLLDLPGGPEAWSQHGQTVYDGHFDLRPDSPHSQRLARYLAAKGTSAPKEIATMPVVASSASPTPAASEPAPAPRPVANWLRNLGGYR